MCDEERVTPFEMAHEAIPAEVTPRQGEGALGTWRSWKEATTGHRAENCRILELRTSPKANRGREGCIWASIQASSTQGRLSEESQGQNRTRESRPSRIVGGPGETRPMVEV
jgi:hypothetical protein